MDYEEFRKLGHETIDLITDYLATIRDTPVFQPLTPQQRIGLSQRPLGELPDSPRDILYEAVSDILPYAMGNGHPRFFGWINSPPAPIGVLADLLAAAQGAACDVGDIAPLWLERTAVAWLSEIVGYDPQSTMGILVSGGSVATLTCLAVARQHCSETDGWNVRRDGLSGDRRMLTYLTEQTHSSVRKAVELLGLGSASIRVVPTDDELRMDAGALERMVAQDRAAGARPFCVVATAGTTNTGAVDPLAEVARVAHASNMWMHVDGAYGAVAALHPELKETFAGLAQADSITMDPHKWLSVPIECGCALVRDRELMRRTFSLVPPYLQTEEGKGVGGPPSYAEFGIQQTRGFRALKVWMVLRHAGRQGIVDLVTRNIALARKLAELVDETPGLRLVTRPQLAVVSFQYVPSEDADTNRVNAVNRALEHALQTDGRTFVTGTVLGDQFVLRASVLHYATTEEDLRDLVRTVCRIGAEVEKDTLDGYLSQRAHF